MSEFAAILTHALELDDPFAKAIIATPPDERITAQIGDQTFWLHHWTVTMTDGRRRLMTTWIPHA